MNIKQTMLFLVLIISFCALWSSPLRVYAACGGVDTSIINCDNNDIGSCSDGTTPVDRACINEVDADGNPVVYTPPSADSVENTGLWSLLLLAINILTAGVGVAAIGGVVYGSVLYTSAGGSSDQTKKAKEIITNVIVGLVAYALAYSFLNFIIPGGLFS
jgi:hypothetical protein